IGLTSAYAAGAAKTNTAQASAARTRFVFMAVSRVGSIGRQIAGAGLVGDGDDDIDGVHRHSGRAGRLGDCEAQPRARALAVAGRAGKRPERSEIDRHHNVRRHGVAIVTAADRNGRADADIAAGAGARAAMAAADRARAGMAGARMSAAEQAAADAEAHAAAALLLPRRQPV